MRALCDFQTTHASILPDAGVKHLDVIKEALDLVVQPARSEVVKISRVKYLRAAHDKYNAAGRKRDRDDPMRKIGGGAVYGLREIIKRCKTSDTVERKKALAPPASGLRR